MLQAWTLAGATATGKSAAAQWLAEQHGYSILSADAMLVYRDMNIGTAKPTPADRKEVPYYGIDLARPSQPFSTGAWLQEAIRALSETVTSGPQATHMPTLIIAGGTGLYFKALTCGLTGSIANPEQRAYWQAQFDTGGIQVLRQALVTRAPKVLANLSDPTNPRRLIRALEQLDAGGNFPRQWHATPPPPIPILRLPREQLHQRIYQRVEAMFAQGLIEEVRALRQTYPVWSPSAQQAIGYAEICALLDGTLTHNEAFERIVIRTRQLAKRQETWFRHQAQAVWIDIQSTDSPEQVGRHVLEIWRSYGPTPLVQP